MFIQSNQAFRFRNGGDKFEIPAHFVGQVPDWVTKTDLYQLAGKGGNITFLGEPAKTGRGVQADAAKAPEAKAPDTPSAPPALKK